MARAEVTMGERALQQRRKSKQWLVEPMQRRADSAARCHFIPRCAQRPSLLVVQTHKMNVNCHNEQLQLRDCSIHALPERGRQGPGTPSHHSTDTRSGTAGRAVVGLHEQRTRQRARNTRAQASWIFIGTLCINGTTSHDDIAGMPATQRYQPRSSS
ncbi:hypothetical protein TRVL_05067 [Trypanosoma vivax]|nr:hypothetical protein TRVL_05067 [Trypanosoma vivax]